VDVEAEATVGFRAGEGPMTKTPKSNEATLAGTAEETRVGSLAVWREKPRGKAVARVLHVHGINEHSARHHRTFAALTGIGVEVVRFDLRGSGRSGGRRQHVDRFEEYVDDVAAVYGWICRELEELPLYLMGHSMGGAIAIFFAAHYDPLLSGLVLSAPGYLVGEVVPPAKIAVGRALARFFPNLRLPKPSESPAISRDPEEVAAFAADPLCPSFNTLAQGAAVLDAFPKLPALCASITVPTVLFHGTGDRLILCEGSFTLFRALRSRDRELHYLPNVFHEPHNDYDHERYFALLTQWLKKRIAVVAEKPRERPATVAAELA
jgi:alpha-beta hydrolase superfamily lysophospholipase